MCTLASKSMRCSLWLDTLSFCGVMSKVRGHGFRGQVTNSYEPEDGEKIKCDNLESKHGLKPGKKICIGLLVVFLGPWQTSGVAKSVESSLDLHT